jgi:hypothetical protein
MKVKVRIKQMKIWESFFYLVNNPWGCSPVIMVFLFNDCSLPKFSYKFLDTVKNTILEFHWIWLMLNLNLMFRVKVKIKFSPCLIN